MLLFDSATVAANATDVYKLALIHEKIPHLSIREVTRKIYDGEISDAVSNLSRWREMQKHLPIVGVEQTNEKSGYGMLLYFRLYS